MIPYDVVGRRYGFLTIRARRPHSMMECECRCGKIVQVSLANLSSNTRSCGCWARELASMRGRHIYRGLPDLPVPGYPTLYPDRIKAYITDRGFVRLEVDGEDIETIIKREKYRGFFALRIAEVYCEEHPKNIS